MMSLGASSLTSTGSRAKRIPKLRLDRFLLRCGVLASFVYVATDIAGGLRYDGYSFTSQAVSELMAVGAPSERLVDPLFMLYNVLVIAFGGGVLWVGLGRSRALRLTGWLLAGYGVLGLTGPTLFEMHQRGASSPQGDLPHIVLTVSIVLLTVVALSAGAFAFGKRFRLYSFATLLTMVVAGAAAVPYGARLAAGEPTPGFGVVERIDIYACQLWIAALGVALLRGAGKRRTTATPI